MDISSDTTVKQLKNYLEDVCRVENVENIFHNGCG